jgi:predicted nucleotidyltransferase component of viral defense system
MAVEDLVSKLSTAFNKMSDSNNYKLLSVIDSEFQNIEQTIGDIENAHFVDFATGKNLDYIGQLFNVSRRQNETDEHYRARIKITFSKLTDIATIKDVKEVVAATLNTETSRIEVRDLYDLEPAYFDIWVFLQDLNNAGLTVEELKDLLQAIKPAGVRLEAKQYGTFTPRSSSDVSDSTKAYNDLANSNPNGGTYAGLL